MEPREPGSFDDDGHRIASAIGVAFGGLLHLVVGAFVLPSGLVAPAWAWLGLVALWVAGALLLWVWRRSPVRALLVPVAMAAIWWAALTAGDVWLGWTA